MLLQAGANPLLPDHLGKSAWDHAIDALYSALFTDTLLHWRMVLAPMPARLDPSIHVTYAKCHAGAQVLNVLFPFRTAPKLFPFRTAPKQH
jgi:hypothetical protein